MTVKNVPKASAAARRLVAGFLNSDNKFGPDPENPSPFTYELTEADARDLEVRIERAILRAIEGKIAS